MTKRMPERCPSLRRREIAIRVLVLFLPFLLALPASSARAAPPPPAVTVATIGQHNVAPTHSFIGRVIAIQSVKIVPRVTAFIDSVPVKQGSDVKSGEIIYELQKSQYQAALQAAQAQLASAQAALANDQVAYERAARLSHQGFEAQSNLDSAIAARDEAQASVETAQANLAQAALNLSYCTIRSPINGRIGAVTLTKGNLVTPSTPAMATINQLDPIRVVFSVAAGNVMHAQQKTGQAPTQISKGLVVNLQLPDGATYNQTGKIAFLGNQVDQQTGTVPIYADFANPQNLLLPGAYVTVLVRHAKPLERLLVPVAAVQTDQSGSYVLTVGPGNKVAQQPIVTGAQIAQNFIVTKGLTTGERVIVTGVQKVLPGEVVNPTAATPPPPASAQATPQAGKGS
ncbi:MAG TPA: efflux RND transporter periplasmic adaptor subunit [Acetobacteraceae bacterium]|nr:efflux RND transporter periplasmic adaptor subunit [Acetobacteraceae bacterium]